MNKECYEKAKNVIAQKNGFGDYFSIDNSDLTPIEKAEIKISMFEDIIAEYEKLLVENKPIT